jgi:hypothetical protein
MRFLIELTTAHCGGEKSFLHAGAFVPKVRPELVQWSFHATKAARDSQFLGFFDKARAP